MVVGLLSVFLGVFCQFGALGIPPRGYVYVIGRYMVPGHREAIVWEGRGGVGRGYGTEEWVRTL